MTTTKYKRVLLKLSGEAFSGGVNFGIDASTLNKVADQIKEHAATMLGLKSTEGMELRDRQVLLPDGSSLTLEQIALSSLH